jgi:chemotaxis protein MotA
VISIIGILVVIGAIVGGYLREHGKLFVLMQPAKLVIIGGAAIGTTLIANPLATILKMAKGLVSAFLPSKFSKKFYLENLKMLNEIFQYAR